MKHAIVDCNRSPRRAQRSLLPLLASALLVIAACSDDSDSVVTIPTTDVPSAPASTSATGGPSSSSETLPAPTGDPIVLGASFGLTGFYSTIGADEKFGVAAAVDAVNRSGGVLGHPLKVIIVDNESDPRQAADSVLKLVQGDGAVGLIMDSLPSLVASVPVVNQVGVPLIGVGGGLPQGFSANDLRWYFTDVDISWQLQAFADSWTEQGITKIAYIAADTPTSDIATNFFKDHPEFELTSSQKFAQGTTNLTPFILNLPEGGAQAILSWTTGPDQANTIKAYKQLGGTLPFYSIGGAVTSPQFVDAAGGPDGLDGILSAAPPALIQDYIDDPDVKAIVSRYFADMQSAGQDAKGGASFATVAWDAVIQLAQAINAAGTTDPEAIRTALESQKTISVQSGVLQRTATDHCGCSNSYTVVTYHADSRSWIPIGQ